MKGSHEGGHERKKNMLKSFLCDERYVVELLDRNVINLVLVGSHCSGTLKHKVYWFKKKGEVNIKVTQGNLLRELISIIIFSSFQQWTTTSSFLAIFSLISVNPYLTNIKCGGTRNSCSTVSTNAQDYFTTKLRI